MICSRLFLGFQANVNFSQDFPTQQLEMKLRCVACLKFPSCLWVSYGHKNAGLFSKLYPGQSQDPGLSPTHCCETSQWLYHFALFSSSGKRSTTISARQACGAHVWKKSIKLTCSTLSWLQRSSHPYVLHIYILHKHRYDGPGTHTLTRAPSLPHSMDWKREQLNLSGTANVEKATQSYANSAQHRHSSPGHAGDTSETLWSRGRRTLLGYWLDN